MADSVSSTISVTFPFIGAILAIVAFKRFTVWWKDSKPLPYPPGPKPLPIVENMFDFPKGDPTICYYNWGKKYNSDILHASSLGFHVVVLNSLEDAEELLEKRASNYSDRLMTPVLELMGVGSNMAMMHHGPTWRKHRRIAQQHFRLDMMSAHEPIQARRVHIMLKALLDDPDNLFNHHKVLSLSIPLEFMYGYDIKSLDDSYIVNAQKMIELSSKYFNPDSTLINFFPILGKIPAWVPGASAQGVVAAVREIIHDLVTEPMEMVKDAVNNGTAVPSVLSDFIEAKQGTPEFEDEAKIVSELAFTIYGAASDTIISALAALFYILVTRPDIQKKGQEEIDRVVGMERLPQFGDRALLPYTDALYRELLRFYPPTPMAVPHRVKEDDTYKGYFIPKGTIVSANVWAMTRDENLYPDPHVFKPERFINENGELTNDARVLTYGFGRRICIGKYSASATLWMTIVSVLACFNFSKAKDADGKDIEISDEFKFFAVITHKTPFKCAITPRSEVVRRLVEEVVAAEKLKPQGNVA
ncbi:cytochrome P450 [Pholiota conissans]|uniref:Cytochrome P450 n=1 Tax=Pholiota conissans TaxID=109636 RepID=A0A9P6CYB9_9AGAR|nr:cytochrome P450 [Pholiota conissans]